MKKHIFIVNPVSGNGKSNRFIKNLEVFANNDNRQEEIKILQTKGTRSATTIARCYSEWYKDAIIYSVGGDGTLNEIVNGMNPKTKLGIIPTGSGNDFYRIYKKIEGTKSIDLGVVNGHKFINIASLGIDAKIADKANRIKNNSKIKLLSYPRAIVEEIVKYKPIQLKTDGKYGQFTLFTICNGKYYGNGFAMNPNYNLSNGFLNMISAGKLTRTQIIILLLKILKQTHLNSTEVNSFIRKNIMIESSDELLCNVDGEIIKGTKFEFETIKDGLTLTTDVPQYVKRAIKTIK